MKQERWLILIAALAIAGGCDDGDAPAQAKVDGSQQESAGGPDAPSGTAVAKQIARPDQDGDGVLDADDRCSGTPAGSGVDATGCVPDADGDGIADATDACAGTSAGARVDATGCRPTLRATERFDLDVRFASGSSTLDPTATLADLGDVVELAASYPESTVTVHAYTDSSGSKRANQALSEARARAVAGVLVEGGGLARSRVAAVGHGEADPVADNDTRDGRAMNRRVAVTVDPAG